MVPHKMHIVKLYESYDWSAFNKEFILRSYAIESLLPSQRDKTTAKCQSSVTSAYLKSGPFGLDGGCQEIPTNDSLNGTADNG